MWRSQFRSRSRLFLTTTTWGSKARIEHTSNSCRCSNSSSDRCQHHRSRTTITRMAGKIISRNISDRLIISVKKIMAKNSRSWIRRSLSRQRDPDYTPYHPPHPHWREHHHPGSQSLTSRETTLLSLHQQMIAVRMRSTTRLLLLLLPQEWDSRHSHRLPRQGMECTRR